MKIEFKKSAILSLKKLITRNVFINVWNFIRYDTLHILKNLYTFRKIIWGYRDWDYRYTLTTLKVTLIQLKKSIERGYEIEESKNKKINKINRAIEIIGNIENDDYIGLIEKKLNTKVIFRGFDFKQIENSDSYELVDNLTEEENKHNSDIYDQARILENEEWMELWNILKGTTNYDLFKTDEFKNLPFEEREMIYNQEFDGSDMRGWWS
jgi:hypothetical protein